MRTLMTVVVLVGVVFSGCRHANGQAVMVSANPAPSEGACVDRLLRRSRDLGYVETMVDKEAGFFRVIARHAANGKMMHPKFQAIHFNVQCVAETGARIGAIAADGAYDANDRMAAPLRKELDEFAGALANF